MSIRTNATEQVTGTVSIQEVETTEPGYGAAVAWDAYCSRCDDTIACLVPHDDARNEALAHICPVTVVPAEQFDALAASLDEPARVQPGLAAMLRTVVEQIDALD